MTEKEVKMGRVKPAHIKNAAEKLIEEYPELFSEDFEENKRKLEGLINTNSKKVKNRIAGYIASNYKSMKKSNRNRLSPS